MLIIGYGLLSDGGVVAALAREIPAARIDGPEAVSRVGTAALLVKTITIMLACVVIAAVATYTAVPWRDLLIAAGILAMSALDQFLMTVSLGREIHRAVVLRNWVFAIAGITLPVIGCRIFGLTGFLVGYLTAQCLALLPMTQSGRIRPTVRGLAADVRRLLVVGLPLMALGILGTTLVNVDQWVILAWLDRSALGLYAIALSAGALVCVIPAAVGSVTLPHLVRGSEAGASADNAHLTQRAMRSVSAVVTVAVVAGLWLIGPVVTNALPRYVSAIGPARVYLVAVFFLATNQGVGGSMLAARRHWINIPLTLGVAGLNLAVDYVLVYRLDLGLFGVAIGSLITYVVYSLIHSVVLHRVLGYAESVGLAPFLLAFAPGIALPLLLVPSVIAGSLAIHILASALALGIAAAFAAESIGFRREKQRVG